MKINENIKHLRSLNHMTLQELAEKLNTTKQTVQRYESGEISNIPYDKIEAMATIFNVTPSILMGWEKPKTDFTLTKDETILIELYENVRDKNRLLEYAKRLIELERMEDIDAKKI